MALFLYFNIYKIMTEFKTEDQFQAYCVKWFSDMYPKHRGMLYSVPNGANLSPREAAKLVATGIKAGVADLHFILSCGRIVFIEMKLPNGTQSDEQKAWQEKVEARGHVYVVIRTFNEFKNFIWSIIGK